MAYIEADDGGATTKLPSWSPAPMASRSQTMGRAIGRSAVEIRLSLLIKAIVKFTFTDQRPKSYGTPCNHRIWLWANVNTQVAHPRGARPTEEFIGTGCAPATQLFHGYGRRCRERYKGLEKETPLL